MWPPNSHHRKQGIRIVLIAIIAVTTLGLLNRYDGHVRELDTLVIDQYVTQTPPGTSDLSNYSTKEILDVQQAKNDTIPISDQEPEQSDKSTPDIYINPDEYPQHEQCVIYDRPTRTGSTTISAKLKSCMLKRGYKIPKAYPKDGKAGLRMVPRMLTRNASRVALAGGHIRILQSDVDAIIGKCDDFLYITSCAPMLDRMWSGVKFELGDPSTSHNKNSTISINREEALEKVLAQKRFEDAREAYPFVNVHNEPLVMSQKLIPNYVIRQERMEEDLKPLLEVLGCNSEITSYNVHTDEDEGIKSVLKEVPLRHSDKAHKLLSGIAKNNSKALEKVRIFA